jgi:hypothetical protein
MLDAAYDAFHEAGHVAGYIYFAQPYEFVALTPKPVVRGLDRTHSPMVEAVLCLSGPVSEAKYSRVPVIEVLARAGRVDRTMTLEALQRYPPERVAAITAKYGRPPSLPVAIEFATGLIDREWRSVCKLAAALLRYDRLSAEEVLAVLGRP